MTYSAPEIPDCIGDHAHVRSKNAGPFTLTIDIFCNSPEDYELLHNEVTVSRIARIFGITSTDVSFFALPDIQVLKFSFKRPDVQGSKHDRVMHGSQYASLVAELAVGGLPMDPELDNRKIKYAEELFDL